MRSYELGIGEGDDNFPEAAQQYDNMMDSPITVSMRPEQAKVGQPFWSRSFA